MVLSWNWLFTSSPPALSLSLYLSFSPVASDLRFARSRTFLPPTIYSLSSPSTWTPFSSPHTSPHRLSSLQPTSLPSTWISFCLSIQPPQKTDNYYQQLLTSRASETLPSPHLLAISPHSPWPPASHVAASRSAKSSLSESSATAASVKVISARNTECWKLIPARVSKTAKRSPMPVTPISWTTSGHKPSRAYESERSSAVGDTASFVSKLN